jgi:antitoxin HigA-1
MAMFNPPHPGAFIQEVYLEPNGMSGRELALKLGVAASTLSRVLSETSGVSPEMALRLSKALGRELANHARQLRLVASQANVGFGECQQN